MNNNDLRVEKFYVFRRLNSLDETWGAVVLGDSIEHKLPNIDFGMKIFAENEKVAIARAKIEYDRIHQSDSKKHNVKAFTAAIIGHLMDRIPRLEPKHAAQMAVEYAEATAGEYDKFVERLEGEK